MPTPAHTHTRPRPLTPAHIHTRPRPHLHVHAECRQRTPALHTWKRLLWTPGFYLLFTHILCRLDASDGHSSLLQNYYKDPRGVSDCSFPVESEDSGRSQELPVHTDAQSATWQPVHTIGSSSGAQSCVRGQHRLHGVPRSTHLRSPRCSGGHPTSQTSPSSTPSPSWADCPVRQRE